jgi:hypothetical protein
MYSVAYYPRFHVTARGKSWNVLPVDKGALLYIYVCVCVCVCVCVLPSYHG